MPQTPEEIGHLIRQLRKERKLTQTELGEKMGITKATVASYETGRKNLTVDTLRRFAQALGGTLKIDIDLN